MRFLHIVMNSPCSMLLTDMMSFFFSLPLTISVPPMDEELSFMCMCASVSHHPFSVAAALSLRVKQRKSLRVRMIQCDQDNSPFIGLEVGASSRRDPSNRRSCSYAAGYACKRAVSVYRHVGLYTDATLDGTNDNCMATRMLNHNEHVSLPKRRVRSCSCMHRIDPC